MFGKWLTLFFVVILLASPNVYSQIKLDEAINTTASEMRQYVNRGNKIAVLNFSSNWQKLSAYVIDELNNAIVRNGSFTVVEKQQLDIIKQELEYQANGDVSDESAQHMGYFLGTQSVVLGSFTITGNTKHFRIRVIAVETGIVQYSNSIIIEDSFLDTFIPKPPKIETDYNFFQQFGIGLLNIPLGFGSLLFDQDKDVVGFIIILEILGAGVGALMSVEFTENNLSEEEYRKSALIGAGIGFGVGALFGFGRGFFVHKPGFKTAQHFPFDINMVPASSNSVGIQMTYKLSY